MLDDGTRLQLIIYWVHDHSCDHALYSNMKTVDTKSGLQNKKAQLHFVLLTQNCGSYNKSITTSILSHASISCFDFVLNKFAYVDNLILDSVTPRHAKNIATKGVSAHVVALQIFIKLLYNMKFSTLKTINISKR